MPTSTAAPRRLRRAGRGSGSGGPSVPVGPSFRRARAGDRGRERRRNACDVAAWWQNGHGRRSQGAVVNPASPGRGRPRHGGGRQSHLRAAKRTQVVGSAGEGAGQGGGARAPTGGLGARSAAEPAGRWNRPLCRRPRAGVRARSNRRSARANRASVRPGPRGARATGPASPVFRSGWRRRCAAPAHWADGAEADPCRDDGDRAPGPPVVLPRPVEPPTLRAGQRRLDPASFGLARLEPCRAPRRREPGNDRDRRACELAVRLRERARHSIRPGRSGGSGSGRGSMRGAGRTGEPQEPRPAAGPSRSPRRGGSQEILTAPRRPGPSRSDSRARGTDRGSPAVPGSVETGGSARRTGSWALLPPARRVAGSARGGMETGLLRRAVAAGLGSVSAPSKREGGWVGGPPRRDRGEGQRSAGGRGRVSWHRAAWSRPHSLSAAIGASAGTILTENRTSPSRAPAQCTVSGAIRRIDAAG